MQMAPTFTHVIDISELHDTYSKPAGEIKVIVKHVNGNPDVKYPYTGQRTFIEMRLTNNKFVERFIERIERFRVKHKYSSILIRGT